MRVPKNTPLVNIPTMNSSGASRQHSLRLGTPMQSGTSSIGPFQNFLSDLKPLVDSMGQMAGDAHGVYSDIRRRDDASKVAGAYNQYRNEMDASLYGENGLLGRTGEDAVDLVKSAREEHTRAQNKYSDGLTRNQTAAFLQRSDEYRHSFMFSVAEHESRQRFQHVEATHKKSMELDMQAAERHYKDDEQYFAAVNRVGESGASMMRAGGYDEEEISARGAVTRSGMHSRRVELLLNDGDFDRALAFFKSAPLSDEHRRDLTGKIGTAYTNALMEQAAANPELVLELAELRKREKLESVQHDGSLPSAGTAYDNLLDFVSESALIGAENTAKAALARRREAVEQEAGTIMEDLPVIMTAALQNGDLSGYAEAGRRLGYLGYAREAEEMRRAGELMNVVIPYVYTPYEPGVPENGAGTGGASGNGGGRAAELPFTERSVEMDKALESVRTDSNFAEVDRVKAVAVDALRQRASAFRADPAGYVNGHPSLREQGLSFERIAARRLALQTRLGRGMDFTPRVLSLKDRDLAQAAFDKAPDYKAKGEYLGLMVDRFGKYGPKALAEAGLAGMNGNVLAFVAPALRHYTARERGEWVRALEAGGAGQATHANALDGGRESRLAFSWGGDETAESVPAQLPESELLSAVKRLGSSALINGGMINLHERLLPTLEAYRQNGNEPRDFYGHYAVLNDEDFCSVVPEEEFRPEFAEILAESKQGFKELVLGALGAVSAAQSDEQNYDAAINGADTVEPAIPAGDDVEPAVERLVDNAVWVYDPADRNFSLTNLGNGYVLPGSSVQIKNGMLNAELLETGLVGNFAGEIAEKAALVDGVELSENGTSMENGIDKQAAGMSVDDYASLSDANAGPQHAAETTQPDTVSTEEETDLPDDAGEQAASKSGGDKIQWYERKIMGIPDYISELPAEQREKFYSLRWPIGTHTSAEEDKQMFRDLNYLQDLDESKLKTALADEEKYSLLHRFRIVCAWNYQNLMIQKAKYQYGEETEIPTIGMFVENIPLLMHLYGVPKEGMDYVRQAKKKREAIQKDTTIKEGVLKKTFGRFLHNNLQNKMSKETKAQEDALLMEFFRGLKVEFLPEDMREDTENRMRECTRFVKNNKDDIKKFYQKWPMASLDERRGILQIFNDIYSEQTGMPKVIIEDADRDKIKKEREETVITDKVEDNEGSKASNAYIDKGHLLNEEKKLELKVFVNYKGRFLTDSGLDAFRMITSSIPHETQHIWQCLYMRANRDFVLDKNGEEDAIVKPSRLAINMMEAISPQASQFDYMMQPTELQSYLLQQALFNAMGEIFSE